MKQDFLKNTMILALLTAVGAGCHRQPPASDVYKVRIPLESALGTYELRTAELRTVKSLTAMSGTVANIRVEGTPEVWTDKRGRISRINPSLGQTPNALFVKQGEVYHPADNITMIMATLMYHFENIKNFFDGLGGNEGIVFPRTVMFNVEKYKINGLSYRAANNAAFMREMDVFWIHPYRGGDIPIAINGGALAHEYAHSVFHVRSKQALEDLFRSGEIDFDERNQFIRLMSQSLLDEWNQKEGRSLTQDDEGLQQFPAPAENTEVPLTANETLRANMIIYDAINEGVADYFGYEYAGNPGYISTSISNQSERNLSLRKSFFQTAREQREWIKSSIHGPEEMRISPHELGSYFSHFLYLSSCRVSHQDYACVENNWTPRQTLQYTLDFIGRYSAELVRRGRSEYLSLGKVLEIFFEGVSDKADNRGSCRMAALVFPGDANPERLCGLAGKALP